jgi:arylsulfatase A-like enzyme
VFPRSRRLFVFADLVCTVVLLAVILASQAPPAASSAPRKANVIVVMTDDMRYDDLAYMPATRHMIGGAGASFERYYDSFSLCCPARATFFSGQYAHNNGVLGSPDKASSQGLGFGQFHRAGESRSLATWLKRNDYRTIHIGKYLNGYGKRGVSLRAPAGWSEWWGAWGKTVYKMNHYALDHATRRGGHLEHFGGGRRAYKTNAETRIARRFIRHLPRRTPFFLSLAPLAPHIDVAGSRAGVQGPAPDPRDRGVYASEPLPQPPSFNEADVSDKPSYMSSRPVLDEAQIETIRRGHIRRIESLRAVDRMVGSLVGLLSRRHLLSRTYIIFTSDNGFMEGEHRIPAGKIVPYEESIHLPLLIRGPGIPAGVHRSQLVGNIDLAPTIAAMTGSHPRLVPDGTSLLGIARSNTAFDRPLLLEEFLPGSGAYTGVRAGHWLYVHYLNDERELYDLKRDPYQLNNLAGSIVNGGREAELEDLLTQLQDCRGTGCRISTPEDLR